YRRPSSRTPYQADRTNRDFRSVGYAVSLSAEITLKNHAGGHHVDLLLPSRSSGTDRGCARAFIVPRCASATDSTGKREAWLDVEDGQRHQRGERGPRRTVASAERVAQWRACRGAPLIRRRQRNGRAPVRRTESRLALAGPVRLASGTSPRGESPRSEWRAGDLLHPIGEPRDRPADGRGHQGERSSRVRGARLDT